MYDHAVAYALLTRVDSLVRLAARSLLSSAVREWATRLHSVFSSGGSVDVTTLLGEG